MTTSLLLADYVSQPQNGGKKHEIARKVAPTRPLHHRAPFVRIVGDLDHVLEQV